MYSNFHPNSGILFSFRQAKHHSSIFKRFFVAPSMEGEVLIDRIKSKKIIMLNRPKALNALNLSMVRTMYSELEADNSAQMNLIIVKGSGGKAFCAGGDVLVASKSYKEGTDVWKNFFREEYRLDHLIGTLKIPYISILHGVTMGGGCGISINGKFRVATEKTMLAMPETALGLFPDVGGTHFLSRLNQKHEGFGTFLALTGYRLNGADVLHSGLATHYVHSSDLPDLTRALVDIPQAECNDENVNSVIMKFQPANLPIFSLAPQLRTIAYCFSSQPLENVVEKLSMDQGEFAENQLSEIKKMSPTSLKVTLRQINLGSKMDFHEVFPMEFRMVTQFLKEKDFHEGCRAILIDKDRNPKWDPARIEDVAESDVEKYFAPFNDHREELDLS